MLPASSCLNVVCRESLLCVKRTAVNCDLDDDFYTVSYDPAVIFLNPTFAKNVLDPKIVMLET